MSKLKIQIAAGTNVGLIRQNNEDNFVVSSDLASSNWLIPQGGNFAELADLGALLVVADGMGGANAGEVASAIAVETIQHKFDPSTIKCIVSDEKAIQKFMVDVVQAADLNILNRSKSDPSTKGMGTTVVMAWILGSRAYICWCGDSRCYALTPRNGLIQISKDHSYVQELVDRGELEPEYMHDHPLSNVITRCLGDEKKRAQPDTRVFELHNGDTIMLCSDGLSGLCYDDQIAEIIDSFSDNAAECKDELISAALNNGGHDNVTVALCTVRTDDAVPQTGDKRITAVHQKDEAESLRATVVPFPRRRKGKEEEESEKPQQEEPIVVSSADEVKEEGASAPLPEAEPQDAPVVGTDQPADVEKATEEPLTEATAEPENEIEVAVEETKDETKDETDSTIDSETEEAEGTETAEAEETVAEEAEDSEILEPDATDVSGTKAEKKAPKGKRWLWFFLILIVILLVAIGLIFTLPELASTKQAIIEYGRTLLQ